MMAVFNQNVFSRLELGVSGMYSMFRSFIPKKSVEKRFECKRHS